MEENIIKLYDKEYKEIIYDNGNTVLKRYTPQHHMWITLQFSQTEDINNIKKITLSCLRSSASAL